MTDLSSWRRVLTTQIGFVAVDVVTPARIPAVKVILVRDAVGIFCSRRRFVLE